MALRLGHVNVREMVSQISWPECLEWLAYMQAEPFGDELGNYRTALVAQAIWNVQIAKAQGTWDAAKTKRGVRPQMRQLGEFLLPYGDSPTFEKKKAHPGQLFEAMREQLMSLGKKPVKRT